MAIARLDCRTRWERSIRPTVASRLESQPLAIAMSTIAAGEVAFLSQLFFYELHHRLTAECFRWTAITAALLGYGCFGVGLWKTSAAFLSMQ
jgi:hypothetical protein